jgi:hypothetical protein
VVRLDDWASVWLFSVSFAKMSPGIVTLAWLSWFSGPCPSGVKWLLLSSHTLAFGCG